MKRSRTEDVASTEGGQFSLRLLVLSQPTANPLTHDFPLTLFRRRLFVAGVVFALGPRFPP